MRGASAGSGVVMGRIGDFRELRVYRTAYDAAMAIFRLSRGLPDEERYSLTSQIRRSSRSVAANITEAWRKRRYPGSFVAKLSDAEAEVAETRVHLDFALGCGYLDRPAHRELDARYATITRQLVRMIHQADRWTPGRASGRPAGKARALPQSPSPRDRPTQKEELRPDEGPESHPQSPGRSPVPEPPREKGAPDEADRR